jgi:alkylated DNA repair protein (DNA oxidative demethylase)
VAARFDDVFVPSEVQTLGKCAFVLRGLAQPRLDEVHLALLTVVDQSPFRRMETPGGSMSVAMTNCGELGWVTDLRGYRYTHIDPLTGASWPPMPKSFFQLATQAAKAAGFAGFSPDACLINRYLPGARLSLHQDKDERMFDAPIVSLSLGMPATFLFGGNRRSDKPQRVPLHHGDIAVWGGEDRLRFHGIAPVKDTPHEQLGGQRTSLTFRQAG